jgi:hypothetical protein
MATHGLKQLLAGPNHWGRNGGFPIAAYSEFMPPPRLIQYPYPYSSEVSLPENDPWGWPITEYEETLMLRPGLEHISHEVLTALVRLGNGDSAHGIARNKLTDNPYWPPNLSDRAGSLSHEHYVILLSLSLSRTQDDKGRVRWTLFGNSEQGPARAFWKSFYTAPHRELPLEESLNFIRQLLSRVYGESLERLADLNAAGFRILPVERHRPRRGRSLPAETSLPTWTDPFIMSPGASMRGVKYILTFRPFSRLPEAVQRAYLAGRLCLLPFPGSLLFWGIPTYLRLQEDLALGGQIPLLHVVSRTEHPRGIRIPQSGWLHEPVPNKPGPDGHYGPVRNTYRRTHRWSRVHRDEDELAVEAGDDKLMHVLFSTALDDMGLYGKPMARNAQIWTHDFRLLLDGPSADRDDIRRSMDLLHEGGLFGYRLQFPAMRVGRYEIYWHRPLVAYWATKAQQAQVVPNAPTGYLTAYQASRPEVARAVEMWPRFLHRHIPAAAVQLFRHSQDPRPNQTIVNIRKLYDTWESLEKRPLDRTFARQLLTLPKEESLEAWLESLPGRANDLGQGHWLAEELKRTVLQEKGDAALFVPNTPKRAASPFSLTFAETSRRSFEIAYWKSMAFLSEGQYRNKNNADCVHDQATEAAVRHHRRDLEALGDYLLAYYKKLIAASRLRGRALAGELPFSWRTDFEFSHFGGWLSNQHGQAYERNLLTIIPGRDRRRAVIMADHYDTAYMEDRYERDPKTKGARIAAAGADDNYSATAALMHGAPIFLELSKQGKLGCDIWLVHLTGEEFPADCMGARHLCQNLIEGNLKVRLENGRYKDLSRVRIQGVYVLDMVAHNNDHDRDVFQIAPGDSKDSLWLAYQAHRANATWNDLTREWNERPPRRGCGRGRRSSDGATIPEVAVHPSLSGEIRPRYDPKSTLYNTDGQIFSDVGIPVVLFMENYDINRCGYHDSHDTMANIDLDYGAAVAAIAIESVARAATETPQY